MSKLIIVSAIALALIAGVSYVVINNNNVNPAPSFSTTVVNQNNDTANDAAAADTSSLDQHSSDDSLDDAALNDALTSI